MYTMKITIDTQTPIIVLPVGDGDLSKWVHLPNRVENVMTQLNELAATLVSVDNQLTKAKAEILAKIDALQLALANIALTPEADAALAALTAQAQALDDIVPDAEASGP